MMISYALYKNKLTNGNYRAIVLPARTYDLEAVIDEMISHGSTLTKQDVMASLDEFFGTVFALVRDGNNVITPLANFSASIKGNFTDKLDSFDPSRHQLKPRVYPNQQYCRKFEVGVQVQQQPANRPMPLPEQHINPNNGDDDNTLTPGGGAKLRGQELQFDQEDEAQGIFLTAEDESRTRVEVVLHNTARELIFLVPSDLVSGQYRLEVRALFGNENIRTGLLEQPLTVA